MSAPQKGTALVVSAVFVLCLAVLVIMLGYNAAAPIESATPHINISTLLPTPTPVLTDTEIVKSGVANYFMPTYSYYHSWRVGGVMAEDPTLLVLANENAKKGIHSLKIIGDTPDKAIETFKVYDKDGHSKDAFFAIVNTQPGTPAYAIGIYKSGNQYSICVIASRRTDPTANQTSTGAYELVNHPDKIEYVW